MASFLAEIHRREIDLNDFSVKFYKSVEGYHVGVMHKNYPLFHTGNHPIYPCYEVCLSLDSGELISFHTPR